MGFQHFEPNLKFMQSELFIRSQFYLYTENIVKLTKVEHLEIAWLEQFETYQTLRVHFDWCEG